MYAIQGLGFLRQEFDLRTQASDIFPPEISIWSVRLSVARYENSMAAVSQETSCCSCGKLVPLDDVHQISNNDPLYQRVCYLGWKCDMFLFFEKRVYSAANTEIREEREGRSAGAAVPAFIPFGLRQSDR